MKPLWDKGLVSCCVEFGWFAGRLATLVLSFSGEARSWHGETRYITGFLFGGSWLWGVSAAIGFVSRSRA